MRTVSIIVLSSIMFLMHIMLAPAIQIFTAKIDFVMISVLMIAVFSKKWYPAVLTAVYSGLAIDITTQAGTFINTGFYLFIAVTLAVAVRIFAQDGFLVTVIASFGCVAVKHLAFVFVLYVMRLSETITLRTFFYGLPSALYTAAGCAAIYFVYKGLFSFSFMQEKKDDGNYIN